MRSMLFLRTSTTACGSSMTLASDCCRNHSFLELTPGSIVSLLTSPTRRRGSAYAAPATAGTTVIIVTQAPAYTAPPVASGYYAAAPVVSQPIYNYAGYGYGYTPGYWNRGYWGRYGWWR